MAADSGFSSDDNDFLILADRSRSLGSRLHDPHDRNVSCRGDAVERQRRRRIARDHQYLRSLILQIMGSLHRVAGDRFDGFGAVGKPRRIAKINVVGARNEFK